MLVRLSETSVASCICTGCYFLGNFIVVIVITLTKNLCSLGCWGEKIRSVAHSGGSTERSEESSG